MLLKFVNNAESKIDLNYRVEILYISNKSLGPMRVPLYITKISIFSTNTKLLVRFVKQRD